MEHTELARMGGIARGKKLSKRRKREIASAAGKAGGRGRKKRKRKASLVPLTGHHPIRGTRLKRKLKE